MYALTLHQPWATLIADGRKRIETRDWPPPHVHIGTVIAIHAGKTVDQDYARYVGLDVGITTGAVVCTAFLSAAVRVKEVTPAGYVVFNDARGAVDEWFREGVKADSYGDFALGRWIWNLKDVRRLDHPVPMRGRQSLWKVDPALWTGDAD